MAAVGMGLQGTLQQLQESLTAVDRSSAAMASYNLIRGLGLEFVLSASPAALALHTSLVFSRDFGLLVFVRKSLGIEEFRDCREEVLKLLYISIEKIGQKITPYTVDIKDTCTSVYTKDKAAKCKIPALDLLIKTLRTSKLMEELKVRELFSKFYGELALKTKIPDTVLEKIYELLGVLGEVHPSEMVNNSEKLFRAFLGELKTQITSTVREPKLPVLAGCLKGLSSLMCNFTKSVEEDPQTSKEIFEFALKTINPQIDLKRYAVPSAGLRLFSLHASQFSTYLLDNYISLFEVLSKWCGHTNAELKKTAHVALEAFLKQVSLTVAKDAERHKSTLQYFMKQFYEIIRNMDSSNKELSIAIRGYGLFAGPCKAISVENVDWMYVELIQRCRQMFLTQADTADDHLYQMPSFLQSIASVLIHLDTVPEVYTPVLEHLMVVHIDSFPQHSPKMQLVCCRAIVKIFLALADKGPVLWNCIGTVVHQGLIRICSKPVVLQKDTLTESENLRAAGEVRTGKWKVPVTRDYLDLFRNLLSCDQMTDSLLADEAFLVMNSYLHRLNRFLYDEFIKSILKIIEKLDLTLEKQNVGEQEDENGAHGVWVIPTSDPAANLHPAKPQDFSAFINLVEFCREILPEKNLEFFEPWVYSFAYELIFQSTQLPLISGFYKLLSVVVTNAKKIKYFRDVSPKGLKYSSEDAEKYSCFALLAKFGKEVSIKMKQYKDELLASCLTLILSLPHSIIELDMKAYVPALQMAFKLGLSCPPLAEVGLNALEEWSVNISKYVIQPYYKDILPCLDGYLKTSALSDETKNNLQVPAVPQASQRGIHKVVLKHLKRTKNTTSKEVLSLEAIRMKVVQVLGSLGGQINRNLVTAASSDEMMKRCVSWDREKKLSFAVPFVEMKPVIYLDTFLPRVTELALLASDRQTKVAACELLHSMVMFMLGKATQIPESDRSSPPMYQLYRRTFPVLLRLGCDVDQVTRQLYEPLVMQLIHWFTSNKKFESQDTVALLETILDGIVDPVDSTLRDFCGRCIREFLKWSIKQTTPQQQEKSPLNTKSLFKRLYHFALHPSASKRLGAALAFNNIYREFREEEPLVEQFVLEALVIYLESLALAHADEKSLGTVQQCCSAIDHLRRIIEKKHETLNVARRRRLPRGFPPSSSLSLQDLVRWLLTHCGRPQAECRHKSMELFYKFVPLLPGNRSPSMWLNDVIKKEGISFLILQFEGGGSCDKPSGILAQPTLSCLPGLFSLRVTLQWMDTLLAALECYNTFIRENTIEILEVLGTGAQSSLLKAVAFFLETLATCDITAAEHCFASGTTGDVASPQEVEGYNYRKCTVVVRIMEFSATLLSSSPEGWKLLETEFLKTNLVKLVVETLCEPASVGFNVGDVEVMHHLPGVCVNLMAALKRSPYKEVLETHLQKKILVQSIEDLCAVDLYDSHAHVDKTKLASLVFACKHLHKAGLLYAILPFQSADQHPSIGSKLLSLVYKGVTPSEERRCLPVLDASSKRLASGLLELAFAFGGQCEHLVGLLLSTAVLAMPSSGRSQGGIVSFSHGEYFYSLFSETINTELLKNVDIAVSELMKSSEENPKMVSTVLNGILDQSFRDRVTQKHQGPKLVTAVLQNWKKCESWWARDSAPESKMAVLALLAKILQIDSSVSLNTNHSSFPEVFRTYTTLLADSKLGLHLKGQAIIILPFFINLTGERLEDLKHILENLVVSNFPMRSDEFPQGTLRYNNYVDCMKKFLDALELSQSPVLLQLMTEILCREQHHVMEEFFQSTFKRIASRTSCVTQIALLESVYGMFRREDLLSNATRQASVDRSLLTLLWHCSLSALREFFSKIVVEAIDVLKSRFAKLNESTFDTQITKKMGFYKMLDVMYSRLPKADVHSKESKINQIFHGSCVTEGNELTKTLIKSCYDAFTENMAGENQLLERRRLYHCAAYNCAISVISCVFNELKFYQGFLFSEKPEKNLLIFENLIDLNRCYAFPIEIEVPMERKKKYIEISKEAREATIGDSDGPHYICSLSYLTESSLSEEMSQFDFSTGVQSYSYSSQDSKSTPGRFRRRDRTESLGHGELMELEMDELNQHECMASLTALLKHMQRSQITPRVEEGSVPSSLPPWMKFLHDKLANLSVPLNIRLFLAKLVINAEEVFRPYAKHWLSPLLQLIVSENNGGPGIHYMVVEIVVTLLSWTSIATPVGVPKDEILANRLLHFLMKHVFHQKRAVFRHNLEIIKTLVECWKDCLAIPYRLIFEKFSSKDPNSKDNSVGIQLLGIVIANNMPPYDPKCGIESIKYFEALVNNMSFIRHKEVYAAAAEVLGLILRYVTENKTGLEQMVCGLVVKQLKQHQSSMEDKFVVCLNKAVQHFPPLADRFMNAVFFLLPKFHGVMKTLCLEVVLCRAEEIADVYLQLKSKDFKQIMRHRDDERQKVCLLIIYKMMAKLKPPELRELLDSVVEFISHPSPSCREQMYNVLMWIHDNYRDPESQKDANSQEIFKLAKDVLIQGLIDENHGLQLIIRNFWSHETRLPSHTLDRLLALNSLYSPKIEVHFLSLATDFLLEMTSLSPDYSSPVFEHPLSECEFQEYAINSDWRFRSTILTPMFIETQASQNAHQTRTQDSPSTAPGLMARQVRATQQHWNFTPTQNTDGRSSFNWLTGSSIDPLEDHTVSTPPDSMTSSLLFVHKRREKSPRTSLKLVGPEFGKKRLGLPGDEMDNKVKVTDDRAEILRLRRRFLKDQEKLSLIYARKNVDEQKREKEIKSELRIKQDAQVILYRSYRQGDLPDIQIKHSCLITPLQAVAQRDPIVAKLLFGSLFAGILKEMDKFKTMSEKTSITQKLLQDFNHFLNTTFHFFPPFVSCIQEVSCQHQDLLCLDPALVSTGCLASLQQPVGILLLEEALLNQEPPEPRAKRIRAAPCPSPQVLRWMELAKLYRSIGEYDVLRGIFSSEIGTKQITQNALLAEAKSDYAEAAKQYNQALNKQDWLDGEPTEAEKDFWELASLDCYNQLTEWRSLAYCSTASVDSEHPPDLNQIWSEPFYQETYLPFMIRSKLKLLLHGDDDQSLLTFVDDAVSKEFQKALLELHYSQELSLLYLLQDDFDRAKYCIENSIQFFLQTYSSIDVLLHRSRLMKLQCVQVLTEIQEFITFMSNPGNLSSQVTLKRLLKTWTNRNPDAKMDPMSIWDDIITNRCFFLSKIEEKFTLHDHKMEVDGGGDFPDKVEMQKQEDIYYLMKDCKFSMKMRMIESARKQNNFSLAMKLLKELREESKTREDWLVRWVHSYCHLTHCRSRSQRCAEQILTVLKTVSLLDENTSDYLSKNIPAFREQNILLGTTYQILADALSSEPTCLAQLEENKARRILELSGSNSEDAEKVIAGLYEQAFHFLSKAAQNAEDETQSSSRNHAHRAGAIDAYMTLVDFCDRKLRKEEGNASALDSVELKMYPALVVEKMLKALKLNSTEARLKFPRLLQIVEQYPEETLSLMTKEICSIPCWQFIGWINHLVALLDKDEAVAVQHTVSEIADNYPQALLYPFIISSESYAFKDSSAGQKNKAFVARLKTKLDQGGIIQDFINALEQLSNPEMLFKDWTDDVKGELAKNPVNKKNIRELYDKMYTALGDLKIPGLGAFRRKFIQTFGKEFDKHFGKGGSKLLTMKLSDFGNITTSLLVKMNDMSKPPGNLCEYSSWMSNFKVEFLRNELEIPGQYDGRGKPLPEYHARIAGFDERVKVMASIRKPKRIVIRGHDEREYPFLVKGGEDLRQDQRIEQLFDVMNGILTRDAACSQRNIKLKTYQVIPMTTRLGLIEWIENTLTLKELLLNNMSPEEKTTYLSDPKAPVFEYRDWLAKMSGKRDAGAYTLMYKSASRTETIMSFRKRECRVPGNLLKHAFLKMSTSPEAFLALRSHFASSHAVLCISHWILGIGDRHLNNFMVSMETGSVVGIDFGHAFGSATQFLPVPELMPFRLTRQFINLMLPLKETGLMYSVMVHALRAFRSSPGLLTDTMDVFIKEPSFDWKNFERKMLMKGGSWIQEINVTEKNWYPRQKINYAKRKLEGANPAVITCDELRLGHEKNPAFVDYMAVARGSKDHNIRAQETESGLSEEIQVKCLIDQATDPNILGRTWVGWEPWM